MQWPFTQTFNVSLIYNNISLIYNTHQLIGLTFQNMYCSLEHSGGCVWLCEREGGGGGPNRVLNFAPWEGQLNFLKLKLNVNQRNQRINVQPFLTICINFFNIISRRPCSKSPGIVEKRVPIISTFSQFSKVRVSTNSLSNSFGGKNGSYIETLTTVWSEGRQIPLYNTVYCIVNV